MNIDIKGQVLTKIKAEKKLCLTLKSLLEWKKEFVIREKQSKNKGDLLRIVLRVEPQANAKKIERDLLTTFQGIQKQLSLEEAPFFKIATFLNPSKTNSKSYSQIEIQLEVNPKFIVIIDEEDDGLGICIEYRKEDSRLVRYSQA